MGNYVAEDYHTTMLKKAIETHREGVETGVDKTAEVDEALKAYAKHQKKYNREQVSTCGNYIRGFYYLTLARLFEPEKYKLAWKATGWL